jgi:hypothetical protein
MSKETGFKQASLIHRCSIAGLSYNGKESSKSKKSDLETYSVGLSNLNNSL